MKTFKDMGIETDKPWTHFHRHRSRKAVCSKVIVGPGGINCACCAPPNAKKMTRKYERVMLKRQLQKEIEND